MTTALKVLDYARSKIGTVESPPNSNKQEFGVWYGYNGVPWCAIFESKCYDQAGLGSQYRHASVAMSLDRARKEGRRTSEFRVGYSACRINSGKDWGPGHTGIVEAVHSNGEVTTIEGNTSAGNQGSQRDGGMVCRRRRSRSYWNKGCISFKFSETPPVAPAPPHPAARNRRCTDPGGHPLMKRGSSGRPVNHLQHYLIISGARISGDGQFGPATLRAVLNHQTWLRDHRKEPVKVDGVVGPKTWQAIHNWADGLKI